MLFAACSHAQLEACCGCVCRQTLSQPTPLRLNSHSHLVSCYDFLLVYGQHVIHVIHSGGFLQDLPLVVILLLVHNLQGKASWQLAHLRDFETRQGEVEAHHKTQAIAIKSSDAQHCQMKLQDDMFARVLSMNCICQHSNYVRRMVDVAPCIVPESSASCGSWDCSSISMDKQKDEYQR